MSFADESSSLSPSSDGPASQKVTISCDNAVFPSSSSTTTTASTLREDESLNNLCEVCGKEILIVYSSHPTLHAKCKSDKAKGLATGTKKEPLSPTVDPNLCEFCGKRLNIKYPKHPTLHAKCHSDKEKGLPPTAAPSPRPLASSASTQFPTTSLPTFSSSSSFPTSTPPLSNSNSKPKQRIPIEKEFERAEMEFEKSFNSFSFNDEPNRLSPSPRKERFEEWAGTDEELVQRIMDKENFYDILNVPSDSTADVVRQKYKKFALRIHPDKCAINHSGEAFKKMSEAFTCLNDPQLRLQYDTRRSANGMVFSPVVVSYEDLRRMTTLVDGLMRDLNRALFGSGGSTQKR